TQGAAGSSVKTIFDKFAKQKDVSLVYGEPVEVGLKQVIPVAKVKYGVGGGGDERGSGGVGGGFKIQPVGVYEVTPDRVTFKSAVDLKMIAALAIVTGGILGLVSLRKK